jgi:hypothetical protein
MNTARCGLVCLSLCLLVYFGCIVSRLVSESEPLPAARDEEFGPVLETIRLRLLAKDLLVKELLSGRLTLFEAAALFRELDAMPPRAVYSTSPDPDPPIRLACPTEEERYCLRVITFARGALRNPRPGRAEIVTERLVVEFEAERCLVGAIRLPDPGSLEPIHGLLQRCAHAGLSAPITTPAPGEDR